MRQATYRLLGLLFRYPSAEVAARSAGLAAELEAASGVVRDLPFHRRWRSLLDAVRALGEPARTELEEEYVELFLLGSSCLLYESAYRDGADGGWGLVAAEVERAYSDSGVAVSEEAAGEPPDHIALELEFMSLVCAEEALAWHAREAERAQDCLRREEAFLDRHLGSWLPALTERVGAVVPEESFYGELAEAARAFVVHDGGLVGALARVGA